MIPMRFGVLLDFPEHPHKSNAEANYDAQKKQRQPWRHDHGEDP
jgi:hypothetical protein